MPETHKPETPLDFCLSFDQLIEEFSEGLGFSFHLDEAFEEATRQSATGQAVHFLEGYHRAKKEGDIESEFDISAEVSIPFQYLFLYQNLIRMLFSATRMYQLGFDEIRKSGSMYQIHQTCDYLEERIRDSAKKGISMPPDVDASTLNLN